MPKRYHLINIEYMPMCWAILDTFALNQPHICARLASKADARALQGWLNRNKLEILYINSELGINCKTLLCAFNQLKEQCLLWPHRH